MPILANGVFYFPSHRRGKMSIGEYFIEPQEPPFKIIPGPLCYLRVSSSLVGHFSQHSESLCAFASKGCLMIIIIFCRHDSILTQGWRDKQQRATDGRAEVDPVSWTPICLSFGVHDVKEATIQEQAPPLCNALAASHCAFSVGKWR